MPNTPFDPSYLGVGEFGTQPRSLNNRGTKIHFSGLEFSGLEFNGFEFSRLEFSALEVSGLEFSACEFRDSISPN